MEHTSKNLFPKLTLVLSRRNTSEIPENRKKVLHKLTDFIQQKLNSGEDVNLNFICTHNSRRSHLSQVWAQAISSYFRIPRVSCYSGGTEVTALFPMVAEALKDSGFQVEIISESVNSVYMIKYGPDALPVIGFSKTYDHHFNPKNNFAAIMTCSQADSGCPFIPGAEIRFFIPFDDPKEYDNTAGQEKKYIERSLQIATELSYVFAGIKLN